MSVVPELWKLMRPRHWVKNGFVLMGALFANAWHDPATVKVVILTTVAFSLAASGVYVFNDLFDRESDAADPKKRNRPLAARTISTPMALAFQFMLWLTGFGVALMASPRVLLILVIYVGINVLYSIRLKHVVLLDVFSIAFGFILRILAGTTGVGIEPSQWLLLCGLMIALFLGFAKRRAEIYALDIGGSNGPLPRKVLHNYQPVFLDKMITMTATCVILTYSLYTMSPQTIKYHHTDKLMYTVPFVMYGVFRYIYSLHRQTTGNDPATEIFRDLHLVFAIAGWLIITVWLIAG